MAESQKNQTEKENIVELKTNIYLLSIIGEVDRKSTRLNSSHVSESSMPSSA